MEICKVCGKQFKKITSSHALTHGMTLMEYEAFDPRAKNINIEPKGNTEISEEELNRRIWGEQVRNVDRPLKDFLDEFDITEKELREITKKFKGGRPIDVKTAAENRQRLGMEEALKVKDKDKVEVFRAETAEILKTEFGFKGVQSKKGPPKSWVLKKLGT
jgi:hypothetical protein